ncbi:hypothetical protein [Sporosarcina aquimarina]|uniref:Uncharacterized protein n=1 Tax=Sporosarcina aquimarina TaxID=114975 RepID=A0ABU4G266_9BACL|nr:hypothetical protein [Sporosarcina aquimarina]MDW0110455.1 hypothetical protein [Sporosarcina aquimarina]
MTNFIEFNTYEDYLTQNTERAQAVDKFRQRERDALQAHAELKAEYEKVIADSVASGKDATKQLDALDAKIAEAERVYIRRQQELAVAHAAKPTGLKTTDVIEAQREWAGKVDAEHVAPFLEKMQKARELIAEAVGEFNDAEREYGGYIEEIKHVYKTARANGDTRSLMYPVNPFNRTSVQQQADKIEDTLNGKGAN